MMFDEKDREIQELKKEIKNLKRQLSYIHSSEYYNQLRFERDVLKDVVNNGEVSKEDKQFIDCTHRNTELLEQQQEFIKYLKDCIKELENESLTKLQNTINLGIIAITKTILQKYEKIIGVLDGKTN